MQGSLASIVFIHAGHVPAKRQALLKIKKDTLCHKRVKLYCLPQKVITNFKIRSVSVLDAGYILKVEANKSVD